MTNINQAPVSANEDARFDGWTRETLIAAMEQCPQTPSQSVLDHGRSVLKHYDELIAHLRDGAELPTWWRVPAWAYTPGLLEHLFPVEVMREYIEFHDAGKVVTRVVDADGKQHFPGHAEATEKIWLAVGGDPRSARLMGMDMDAHLLKGDGIEEFASRPEAVSLLITALAEVHSNAAMFGGVDSTSFKIKAKHLDKRGKQVVATMQRLKAA